MAEYICLICWQSFPSSTTLLDHVRCHDVLSLPMKNEDKLLSRHGLRINPKKSQRFENVWPENVKDTNHAKVEKGSSSLNASFEMNNRELIHGEKDDLRSGGSQKEKEMRDRFCFEMSMFSTPVKKERTRSARKVVDNFVYPPALCKEVVNAAEILLKLSRDNASWKRDSADKISLTFASENKAQYFPSEVEDRRLKKPKFSSLERSNDHGDFNPVVPKSEKRILSTRCDSESGMSSSCNKKMYGCTTCNKFFDSFQALGGHRSSHNKVRGESKKLTNGNRHSHTARKSPENSGNHVCNLCRKSFPSGQALGGHKRSHFVPPAVCLPPPPAPTEIEQKTFKPDSIDLNLPAADDEC